MARQEEKIAQMIVDMKRAVQRRQDDSEAEELIQKPTNRGNKLKRGAKFVQEGRLDLANPVKRYRKTLNYNGFTRDIISKNSLRADPDGDVFADDEVDSTVELSDIDEDPYRDVHIEDLLMPLTSAGALKDHPTLSQPYTSKALEELVRSAQEMVQREQNNLWRLKNLTSGLRGDASWMPCGLFETDHDIELITQTLKVPSTRAMSVEPSADIDKASAISDQHENGIPAAGSKRDGGDGSHAKGDSQQDGVAREDHQPLPDSTEATNTTAPEDATAKAQASTADFDPDETLELDPDNPDADQDGEDEEDEQPAHRMTTRAKAAEAVSSPTLSSHSADDLTPHPFFLLPPNIIPSRDLGIPGPEAADTRRLVSAFIQKQEDAVRNSWKLLNGVMKAKRYRDSVMEWCTAEAHVGEMSDGEDWYDKDYWGLEGDLKKGQEEQEGEGDELGVGGRKKTRRARGAQAPQ